MPDWKQCEGQLAGGEFPLDRYLGGSEESAVYLTRVASGRAAIKLVSAGRQGEELVARWNRAALLRHPNLIRIFAAGTWESAGIPLAYLVVEFAEENLAEVLYGRPLTAEEAREMLLPVADALAYLHGQGLSNGELKPSNIFAVEDAVKVSTDAVSTGDPAADIRALGAVLVQALTRQARTDDATVDALPVPFRELAQNCLRGDPRLRWSARKVAAWLRTPEQPVATLPASAAPAPPANRAAAKPRPPYYIAACILAVVAAAIVGGSLMRRTDAPAPSTVKPAPQASAPAPPEPAPAAAPAVPKPSPVSRDGILHRVLPEIPAKARGTVHGTATVVVKVAVSPSGDVTQAALEPGGSAYFGKLTLEAAKQWQFAPAEGAGPRNWVLRFEITRTGTRVIPIGAGRK